MTLVPLERFGKDHWSTFAYLETRVVDHRGVPDREHMRVDESRHPFQRNRACAAFPHAKYPTRLRGDETLPDHDDWDCLEDLEAAGLLKDIGTGMNPVVALTAEGRKVAAQLRAHKASGGSFANFTGESDHERPTAVV